MNIRYTLPLAIASLSLFTACGSVNNSALTSILAATGAGSTAQSVVGGTAQVLQQSGGNILNNLLSSFTSQVAVTEQELVGTWNYKGTDCVFESSNLLSQAGGATAAGVIENKLDGYLSQVGIKAGSTKFVFNADKTFTANLGGRTLSGTYTYTPSTKAIVLQVVGGLFSFSGQVARNANGVSLLFEGDKLLTILRYTSGLMGNSSTASTAASLLSTYKGMHVGLRLTK